MVVQKAFKVNITQALCFAFINMLLTSDGSRTSRKFGKEVNNNFKSPASFPGKYRVGLPLPA